MALISERRTVIALDVGEARIGVARGEEGSSFAFGRGHIIATKQKDNVQAVKDILNAEKAELVVVGLPTRSDGTDSKQTQRVRAFAQALQNAGMNVVFEDERFTTRIASQGILSSGLPKKKRQEKGRLDEAAAILILESYLNKSNLPPR